jgi:2'-5' RNA ligase
MTIKINTMKQLYFIALLPPNLLATQIHSIKEEVAAKFNSTYSLKIPEHITLIPPFHCSDELFEMLRGRLANLCQEKRPFEVFLRDFGHFSKSVLYIQASSQPKESLADLHSALVKVLSEEFSSIKFPQNEEKFTPHLTIANGDLSKKKFNEAWEVFSNRKFEERFTADAIHILKHVDKLWQSENELEFGK